jgi:hypothetical protein
VTQDEIYDVLVQWHREVAMPEMKRIFDEELDAFRADIRAAFAKLHERFDRPVSPFPPHIPEA